MEKETNFLSWNWGFTNSAENWNGRLAMIGFLFTIIIEFVSGKGVLHYVGLL